MKRKKEMNEYVIMLLLRVMIMKELSRRQWYAYALVKRLAEYDFIRKIFKSREEMTYWVYNALKYLKEANYVKTNTKIKNNRAIVLYSITEHGKESFLHAKEAWKDAMKRISEIMG
ncbi:MAG: hypothetical protein QXL16_01855 [Candidatus Micrarchaeaceae archaeon]